MMEVQALLPLAILFLLLNLGAGLARVARGPTAADRMLAALLFGSTTVAVLLLLAEWMQLPALRDVALLFVLLATIISVAFIALPSHVHDDGQARGQNEDEV